MLKVYFSRHAETAPLRSYRCLGQSVYSEYKAVGWRVDRISFKRHRLRKAGEKSIVSLDKAIGLEKRKRYSYGVKKMMAE